MYFSMTASVIATFIFVDYNVIFTLYFLRLLMMLHQMKNIIIYAQKLCTVSATLAVGVAVGSIADMIIVHGRGCLLVLLVVL